MPIFNMSNMVWKCFRCNLSFKDENLAEMHKEISNHSITKVKTLVA
jgi:Zn-finger protein